MSSSQNEHDRSDLLLVLASFHSGGAEKVLTSFANSLHPHLAITVLVLDPRGPLRDRLRPDIKVVALDRPRARSAAAAILRSIRRSRPTVVLSSQTHINILLAVLRPLMPRGTRLLVREAELRTGRSCGDRLVRLAQRTVYASVDIVLATSSTMADELQGRVRAEVEILHNPLDEDRMRRGAAPPLRRPGSGRRFIHLGRFAPGKGAAEVVEAFAAIARPDDHLSMVGDGPELPLAEAAVARHGLDAQVEFHGYLVDPSPLLAGADVLVLPSLREGMPNVALEALAVGTRVLATEDLTTLNDLVASCGPNSVTLVPRNSLTAAMASIAPNPPPSGQLRASLLPPRHRIDTVTHRLLEHLTVAGPPRTTASEPE